MYQAAFLASVFLFLAMTVFVYWNYPKSWHDNKLFRVVLFIWHLTGMAAISVIFTTFKMIPHAGIKYEIVRIGTYYYLMILLLTMLFAVRLLISRLYVFIQKKRGVPIKEEQTLWLTDKRVHAIVFIVIAYAVTTAGYFNIDILHTTEYDISIHKKSTEKDLNVLLLADLHAGSGNWEFTYTELAEQIRLANADVILLAGDIFDETTSEHDVELVKWMLETIPQPRYGIYYVYGNHDDRREDWAGKKMREMGVTTLEDTMTLLGEDVQLIGHDDPNRSLLTYRELMDSLTVDYDKPVLMLTHRPKQFHEMAELGIDLAVAGHTHGFNIPFFMGEPARNDMYYGWRQYGDLNAVTTSGVAAWGWHYKWPAISEIVLIHLHFE